MATKSTMVREYRDTGAMQKEANKLAGEGWNIVTQSEQTQRSGCGRILMLGPFALLFHPKPRIVVTYRKA